ncbi:hypothetical protein BV898_03327 [Hypsibius exemplaris]|uniref:Uncharacterized protein n=1 Tax=Hypsibius exemplaris TaxID=2072580 RepID=A0A1W0X5S1_HYPEX|nr:hypothetical protein BV898_03327 [Hypsibius exemplaris]
MSPRGKASMSSRKKDSGRTSVASTSTPDPNPTSQELEVDLVRQLNKIIFKLKEEERNEKEYQENLRGKDNTEKRAISMAKAKEIANKRSRFVEAERMLQLQSYPDGEESLDDAGVEGARDGPLAKSQTNTNNDLADTMEGLSLADEVYPVMPLGGDEHLVDGVPNLAYADLVTALYENGYRVPEIVVQCRCGRRLRVEEGQMDRLKMESIEEDREFFAFNSNKWTCKSQVELEFQRDKLKGYGNNGRGKMKISLGKLNEIQEKKWNKLNVHLRTFQNRRVAVNAECLVGSSGWIECSGRLFDLNRAWEKTCEDRLHKFVTLRGSPKALHRAKVIENDHVRGQALIIAALNILVGEFMAEEDEDKMDELALEIEAEMENLFSADKIRITHRCCHETANRPDVEFPVNVHPEVKHRSFRARTKQQ